MITRTSLTADYGRKSPVSLKAEVMILLIITIFGLIGLSFCIGLYSDGGDISANLTNTTEIHALNTHGQQAKT